MPSKDSINMAITVKSREQLESIRKSTAKELKIDVSGVTLKHADIIRRLKADRGKLLMNELRDIVLGRLK